MCCSAAQQLEPVVIMTLSDAQGDASLELTYRNRKLQWTPKCHYVADILIKSNYVCHCSDRYIDGGQDKEE